MEFALTPPAKTVFLFIPAPVIYTIIPAVGIAIFLYMISMRMFPLLKAAPDARWNNMRDRISQVLNIWLLQARQPRYMVAGVLHILLFAGFLVLGLRSLELIFVGIIPGFRLPGMDTWLGSLYTVLRTYAATWVFVVAVIAMVRRGIIRPARYEVPAKYGKAHTGEAVFVLGMICTLVLSESLFEASQAVAELNKGMHPHLIPPLTLAWGFKLALGGASLPVLNFLHNLAYFLHEVTFFTFLCFLPLGKHFHVVTSLFNVFFMRLRRGNIKPVRHGISDEALDDLDSFGVKKLEDFTWKHILDFYSCADCGRCSDNCPANAVGRPLSPRFISIKGRDMTYKKYALYGSYKEDLQNKPLIGSIYSEDEIWSCTTCGACEQECPIGIEYIDKIVDLRRGMVDEGLVPQSLQKPLSAIEKRGNPWGKMEKKRADWVKELSEEAPVKVLDGGDQAEVLYFVDSITSFDDRMQSIAKATARLLHRCGADFGILGKEEKDSGHEVRRFGEEMLFQNLKGHNTEMILASGATRIVTADPHAYNALKNDYTGLPPVEHISQFLFRQLRAGNLPVNRSGNSSKVYTYHDPCYLGRHNGVYEDPRDVLDYLGLMRIEMQRSKDRSFCCGGGGLMLFYEPEEEQRMGVLRVKMAAEAGVNVIVTACPFCLVNIEDAIKVAGLEGKMEAIDLAELVASHLEEPVESRAEEEALKVN